MKKRIAEKIEECLTWMMLSGMLIMNIWLHIANYTELVALNRVTILSTGMIGVLCIVRIWRWSIDIKEEETTDEESE